MPHESLKRWQLSHDFLPHTHASAERRTRWVLALTLAAMVIELIAGYWTGSLALTADGWHMGSHAAALGISVFAYVYSRRHARDARFTFGTGKVGPLAGYTSALLLAAIALAMIAQSVERLLFPQPVQFDHALWVAVFGLIVNLVCAGLLGDHGHDEHGHAHHHDHNLRAAYLHVVADALTSLLAIVALLAGKLLGWLWMDPLMGIAGALVILKWSAGLLRQSGRALLDAEDNRDMVKRITGLIESDADSRIADLHVWRLGPSSHGCIVSVVAHQPHSAEHYKSLLGEIRSLSHVTVEVNVCCAPDQDRHWQ